MIGPKHLQRSTMEVIVPPGAIMRTLSIISADDRRRRLTPEQRLLMRYLWNLSSREVKPL